MFYAKLEFIHLEPLPSVLVTAPVNTQSVDSLIEWLDDVCEVLSDAGSVRFSMGGFGEEDWPVDVCTDLSVMLEQIPTVLDALRRDREFELCMYEQGVEMRVVGNPMSGGAYWLRCSHITGDWTPNPDTEIMSKAALNKMFLQIAETFLRILKETNVVQRQLVTMWKELCKL